MPRAIISDELGPPEAYAIREHSPPAPGPGQISLAVKAIGISYVDVLIAEGKYQVQPPLPFIPGTECAGYVEAVGEGVTNVAVGDRVMGSSFGGIFADLATVRGASFNKVPDALTMEQAAVFPPSYTTAFHALIDRGRLGSGETLLVLGAAGATGVAAIQIGKTLGAFVVASASSETKRRLCLEAGADAVVDTRSTSWRDEVKAASNGRAIDVVFDPVGGNMTDPAFRTLAYDGRYLVIGFTGGIGSLKTNLPLVKTASLIGVQIRTFGEAEPERAAANSARCIELAASGALKPMIGKVYDFDDFRSAMRAAFDGSEVGRVVLRVG